LVSRQKKKQQHGRKKREITPAATVDSSASEKPTCPEPKEAIQEEGKSVKYPSIMRKPESQIAVWGLVIAVIVGAIYFLQLLAMQGQLIETRKQTRWDERPWLRLRFAGEENQGFHPVVSFSRFQPVSIPSEFMNVGKSPALKIQAAVIVEIVPMGQDPALPEDKQDISRPGQAAPRGTVFIGTKTGGEFLSGVIYSNQPAGFNATRVQYKNGSVIPWTLGDDEFKDLQGQKAFIAIWGKVWYSDVFGIEHWAKFCSVTGIDPQLKNRRCAEYNDADSNDGT
jgi:hypothetical protein